jgi:CRP/FNR family transcriptional regulator, cyclic AMP receptor protein
MHNVVSPAGLRAMLKDVLLGPEMGSRRINLDAEAAVYEPGAAAEHAYYIHQGQVRIYQSGPEGAGRLLEILGPDEWFGVEPLAGSGHYHTRAVAVKPSILWQIPTQRLIERVSQQTAAAAELIQQIAAKLHEAREDAARLVFDDCHQRLLKTLVRFSRSAAAVQQPDGVVLHITHQQLAQAVGVARETISLALTQLRHQNLLRTGRNQLTFDPQVLARFAERPRLNGSNGLEVVEGSPAIERVA